MFYNSLILFSYERRLSNIALSYSSNLFSFDLDYLDNTNSSLNLLSIYII